MAKDHAGGDASEYAHSQTYLRRLAASNGLEEKVIQVLSLWLFPGHFAVFRKP